MAYFVRSEDGTIFEAEDSAAEQLAGLGIVPATPADITKHNAADVAEQEGIGVAAARAVTTKVAAPLEALRKLPDPTEALFGDWGVTPEAQRAPGAAEAAVAFETAQRGALQEQFTKAAASAEAFPVTSALAGGALDVAAGLATGGATLPAAAAGLGVESLAQGAAQEALDVETYNAQHAQEITDGTLAERKVTASGVAWNGLLNLGFGAAGYGLGRLAFGAADPLADAAGRATNARAPRAIASGSVGDLTDPAVVEAVQAHAAARASTALDALDEALGSATPPVPKNSAQVPALRRLAIDFEADGAQDLATAVRDATQLAPGARYRALLDLREGLAPDAAAARRLDDLISSEALWSPDAVAHGRALAQVQAARAGVSGTDGLTDLAAALDADPTLAKHAEAFRGITNDLDSVGAAQIATPVPPPKGPRSAGAASATDDLGPEDVFGKALSHADEGLDARHAEWIAQNVEPLRVQTATHIANEWDSVMQIKSADIAEGLRASDFERGAETWTEANIKAQDAWIAKDLTQAGDAVSARIQALGNANRGKVSPEMLAAGEDLGAGFNFRGFEREALQVIQQGQARVAAATGGARNYEINLMKSALQKIEKRAQAMTSGLDAGAQKGLIDILQPYQETLRTGLEDAKKFGRNAAHQQDLNAAYTKGLNAAIRVENQLTKITGQKWAQAGVDSFDRTTQIEAVAAALAKDPNLGKHLLKDISTTLEMYQGIAEARKAYGYTRLESLDGMVQSLNDIRDSFKFARAIGIVEERAARAARSGGVGAAAFDLATDVAPYGQGIKRAAGAWNVLKQHLYKPEPPSANTPMGRALKLQIDRMRRVNADTLGEDYFSSALGPKGSQLRQMLTGPNAPTGAAPGAPPGPPQVAGVPPAPAAPAAATVAPGGAARGFAEVAPLAGTAALGAAGLTGYAALRDRSKQTVDQATLLTEQRDQEVASAARAITDRDYAERVRSARAPGPPDAALAAFLGEHDSLAQAFAARREALETLQSDPMRFVDSLTEQLGSIADQAPELHSQLTAKAYEIASFLQTKMPPQRGQSVTRPRGLPPSALEQRTFALYYSAATDPSTALADAHSGRLRHEQVEALREVWPDVYQSLRNETLLAMGNGRASLQQRQRADLLFGFGEALDPAFSSRLSAAAAEARAAAAEEKPSQGAGPDRTRIPQGLTPGGLGALSLGAAGGAQ
jgi:hypothetical protein